MKTKIIGIELKDIILILLLIGNVYQWYQMRDLRAKVEECNDIQKAFVSGIEQIVRKKKQLDKQINLSLEKEDSLAYMIDSLDEEVSILNNRLYRLNKYHEKKYHIYDTASVNELKQYFSRELFKN